MINIQEDLKDSMKDIAMDLDRHSFEVFICKHDEDCNGLSNKQLIDAYKMGFKSKEEILEYLGY